MPGRHKHLLFYSALVRLFLTAPAAAWVLSDRLGLLVSDWRRTKFLAAVHMRNKLAEQLAIAETSLLTAARKGSHGTSAFALQTFMYH